ncbi:hypothetical protein X907_0544 [Glycocaulis alkaliphilus]|uniref:Uncharacterized protein n=1 Tax=Glycocaulis alkaliphilus TaxID=1434191 RepID=A0A3T0E6R7_9PROT|nr:hypothetical protein X907_0544 [Glycocaulis alkaliphilus]
MGLKINEVHFSSYQSARIGNGRDFPGNMEQARAPRESQSVSLSALQASA